MLKTPTQRSACDNSTFSHYHSCDLYAESETNTIPVKGICPLLLCTQFSALGSITTENSCGCYIVHRRSIMFSSNLSPVKQVFSYSFNFQKIRCVFIEGEIHFCLSDVCSALNLTTPAKTVKQIKSEFKVGELNSYTFDTGYGIKKFSMISEPQLYFVMMRSNSDLAHNFRQWICKEVLPTIRKEGQYSVNNSLEYEDQRHQSLAIPIFTVEDFNQANFSLKNYQKIMSESFKFFTDAIFNVEVSDQKLAHTLIEMFNQLNLVARKAGGQERTKLTTFFVAELRKMLATLYKERYQLLEDNRELNHKLQQVKQVFQI